jgi:hypothetical protein
MGGMSADRGVGAAAIVFGLESRVRLGRRCGARTPAVAPNPPPCYNPPDMRRLAITLLAALFLLSALSALSCGSGSKNEPAASPTSQSAVAAQTPAASPVSRSAVSFRPC